MGYLHRPIDITWEKVWNVYNDIGSTAIVTICFLPFSLFLTEYWWIISEWICWKEFVFSAWIFVFVVLHRKKSFSMKQANECNLKHFKVIQRFISFGNLRAISSKSYWKSIRTVFLSDSPIVTCVRFSVFHFQNPRRRKKKLERQSVSSAEWREGKPKWENMGKNE